MELVPDTAGQGSGMAGSLCCSDSRRGQGPASLRAGSVLLVGGLVCEAGPEARADWLMHRAGAQGLFLEGLARGARFGNFWGVGPRLGELWAHRFLRQPVYQEVRLRPCSFSCLA